MTPLDVLRIIFGIVLIFFLPGFMLIKALFPGSKDLDKEYNTLYVITLGMAMSIVITILSGFVLGSIPPDSSGKGYFKSPFIEINLVSITMILFAVAWYRGGFPIMGRLHSTLLRVPKSEKAQFKKTPGERVDELVLEFKELARRRERLKRDIRDSERKMSAQSPAMREHYKRKLERQKEELEKVKERIKELEELRAEELDKGET
jgi:hypothetical protein